MTTTISLQRPYGTRPIRPLGLWQRHGWQVKQYGIADGRPGARKELVEAVRRLAEAVLPSPAVTDRRYGVAFVGAHDARGGCFAFIDWWADDNELHHHAFSGPDPDSLAPVSPDGAIACAWDLAVIGFERAAWLESVLVNPAGPDLAAYLRATMTADV